MTGRAGAGRAPIAIVGIGCRFAGGVDGPARFWELLVRGGDAIGLIPTNRFDRDTTLGRMWNWSGR